MKILDRYVLRSFLINYLISFLVLIGMYIVLDMVFNFDELVEKRGDAALSTIDVIFGIGQYYFFRTFLIFVQLSGVIPVAAAAFTLIRMTRFNELTAILAAGVPLLRVATPIILAAVILQGLLAIDQELIIPNIIPTLTTKHDEIYAKGSSKSATPIRAMQDDRNGLLFAGEYSTGSDGSAVIHVFDLIERNEEGQTIAHTSAAKAEWEQQQQEWKLTDGKRISNLLPEQDQSPEKRIARYKSNITPDEIALYKDAEFVNLLSTQKIDQLLQRKESYGVINLLRVKHFRIAQLVMNFVMVLVAIPCVLSRDPGKLRGSIFRCLVLVGLCMASYFIAYQLAGRPPTGAEWADRWPAIIAFSPVLVFGVIAVVLLDKLPS